MIYALNSIYELLNSSEKTGQTVRRNMKEFFKIHMLIGLAFGVLFTVFANVLYEITDLNKLLLIGISTIISTIISIVYHIAKALYEIFKERHNEK